MTEEFEKWAKDEGLSLEKDEHGEYWEWSTKRSHRSWQASRKQALEEAAAKCDEVAAKGTVFVAGLFAAQACVERVRALQQQ